MNNTQNLRIAKLPPRILGYSAAEIEAAQELVGLAEEEAMHGSAVATHVLGWLRNIAEAKP